MPSTPTSAIPLSSLNIQRHHHQHHSISVPNSPLTQAHNNNSVFQFNTLNNQQIHQTVQDGSMPMRKYPNNDIDHQLQKQSQQQTQSQPSPQQAPQYNYYNNNNNNKLNQTNNGYINETTFNSSNNISSISNLNNSSFEFENSEEDLNLTDNIKETSDLNDINKSKILVDNLSNQNSSLKDANDESALITTSTYNENDVEMVEQVLHDMMQKEEINKDLVLKSTSSPVKNTNLLSNQDTSINSVNQSNNTVDIDDLTSLNENLVNNLNMTSNQESLMVDSLEDNGNLEVSTQFDIGYESDSLTPKNSSFYDSKSKKNIFKVFHFFFVFYHKTSFKI